MGVANDLRFCRFSHRKLIILLPTFHIVYSNFAVVKFVCNVLFSHLWLCGNLVWIEEEITLIKAVA